MLDNTSGFVYYVSMTGITGSAMRRTPARVGEAVARIKSHTGPAGRVGFGVKTAEQARGIAPRRRRRGGRHRRIVNAVADSLDARARQRPTGEAVQRAVHRRWCSDLAGRRVPA